MSETQSMLTAAKKVAPTPKNPQAKNPLRRAMKGKGRWTKKVLAKSSLKVARAKELKAWMKERQVSKDAIWK